MASSDLDRTDLALLAELQRNGRLTNADLAERVHLSPSAWGHDMFLKESIRVGNIIEPFLAARG